MTDSDLNPLTRSDVEICSIGRITIAVTRRTALSPGGKLVALMFAHQDSGKLDAYVYNGEDEHHIEV